VKSNGHLPVLGAVVACLIYMAIPAPRAKETDPRPDLQPEPAAPAMPVPDPKFGSPTPFLRGPVWEPREFDLRMKIPRGWVEHQRRGRQYLSRDVEKPRDGNINVISLPNFFGKDLDGILEENRQELEDNPAFEMSRAEKLRLGGRELLRIDYRGAPANSEDELRFVCLLYRRGRNNVALTVTVREELWPEIAEQVERSLASLQFRPKPASKQ
jgi:hypothetical protein